MLRISIYIVIFCLSYSCSNKNFSQSNLLLKSKVKLLEESVALTDIPSSIRFLSDTSLLILSDNKIILINPLNGKLSEYYNINNIDLKNVVEPILNIDTKANNELIKKLGIDDIDGFKIAMLDFEIVDNDEIMTICRVSIPEINIPTDTSELKRIININYKNQYIAYSFNQNKKNYIINKLNLLFDTINNIYELPVVSFFKKNDTFFIGRTCTNQEGFKYSIAGAYNIRDYNYINEIPIFLYKSPLIDLIEDNIDCMHNYTICKTKNKYFIEAENVIYDMDTYKPIINVYKLIKDTFNILDMCAIDSSKFLIKTYSSDGMNTYEINPKNAVLLEKNNNYTKWLNHPTKNRIYKLSKDSLNYFINTYEF